MHLAPLNELLLYQNGRVIERYQRNFPHKADQASDLFIDMLKYLWLARKHAMEQELDPEAQELAFMCVMHQEMIDVDEMWHTFILFTKDYTEFCLRYFGQYMHHVPNVVTDHPQTEEEFKVDLYKYLNFAFSHLGEQTLQRWFGTAEQTLNESA